MFRHRGLLLVALCALSVPFLGMAPGDPAPGAAGSYQQPTVVGPTQILYMDADSVFYLRSAEWWSANTRHEEKLLLRSLRMKYWSEHLPADMRRVFLALGYPTGRVLLTPVGYTEEWWYYGPLDPPLRFRDGVLLDPDRLEAYLARL